MASGISARDYIRWVQRSLNRLFDAGLIVDGATSADYYEWVQEFKWSRGLPADNVVDEGAQNALIKANHKEPVYVMWAQEALVKSGAGYDLKVDGIFGNKTKTSLQSFQAYNDLVHWRSNHPELPLFVDGFSDIMHQLVQVSHIIVTRGGTTTCAKSLHYGCPIVFNAFGGIMPQEKLTWKFFRNGAGSQKIESAEDFGALIDSWMASPASYDSYREDFLSLQYPEDQVELISDLVGLAEDAAGWGVTRLPFRASAVPFSLEGEDDAPRLGDDPSAQ